MWESSLHVRSSDADYFGELAVPALCLYLQEAAWEHARQLDWGLAANHTWVLARLAVEVGGLPRWGQGFRVQTWARGVERSFAARDFLVVDRDDEVLSRAASLWLVIDRKDRRVVRLQGFPSRAPVEPDRRALRQGPVRVPRFEPAASLELHPVLYSDLDVNRHVNYATYVRWFLDLFDLTFRAEHDLTRLDAEFLAEAVSGDRAGVQGLHATDGAWLAMCRNQSGSVLCRARTLWRRREEGRTAQVGRGR